MCKASGLKAASCATQANCLVSQTHLKRCWDLDLEQQSKAACKDRVTKGGSGKVLCPALCILH